MLRQLNYFFILPSGTKLQNIVANKAIISSISYGMNEEIVANPSIFNIILSNHQNYVNDLYLFAILYVIWYRICYVVPKLDYKLGNIEEFLFTRKRINTITFFFFFLLTRNVEDVF